MKETIGQRFKVAIEKKYGKFENKVIAQRYGVSEQAVIKFKRDDNLTKSMIEIARIEGINLNYLSSGIGSVFLDSNGGCSQSHVIGTEDFKDLISDILTLDLAEREYLYHKIKAEFIALRWR
ncbi:MAG: hypothetical protein ACTTJS_05315 [Wolinella sp.]